VKDDQRLHVTTRKAGSYFNNVQSRASRLVRDAVFARGRENLRAWLPSLRSPVSDSDAVSASDRVRREALGGALWVADRAAIRGDELSISGWIIRLPEDRGDIQPCLNGRPFERFASGEPRPDLSSATFVDLPLHPPSSLKGAGFDLIVGVSIFTHLTETVQLEWLGELQRLSASRTSHESSARGSTSEAARPWRSGAGVRPAIQAAPSR